MKMNFEGKAFLLRDKFNILINTNYFRINSFGFEEFKKKMIIGVVICL